MIEITEAENYRECNVCHSNKEVKNISFWTDGTKTGVQIALCKGCRIELLKHLDVEI